MIGTYAFLAGCLVVDVVIMWALSSPGPEYRGPKLVDAKDAGGHDEFAG